MTKTRLVYGTMGLGGSWEDPTYGDAELEKAEKALLGAYEIGIRYIDTADIYRRGSSESIVGEVLNTHPELGHDFKIQTKWGIQLADETHDYTRYDSRADYLRECISRATSRLGRPIDVMLIHRADPLMDIADTAKGIRGALADGSIGAWGVSNYSGWQIARLADAVGSMPVVNQLELSLGATEFIDAAMNVAATARPGSFYTPGTVEFCADNSIEVQAWSPLAGGSYSRDYSAAEQEKLAPNVAHTNAYVHELATHYATTPETIVLWWLTMHPAHIVPVIGTTNPARIEACTDANNYDSRLTRDEWYKLFTLARGEVCP